MEYGIRKTEIGREKYINLNDLLSVLKTFNRGFPSLSVAWLIIILEKGDD